ncbi:hypothetical protein H6G54_07245 [Anabaena cylindrica FACHB-243]|uniref:Uncharacterized protein n=1 Tax=Anabaena cylindrica (strain ATCC 27899 / PCC 7122) TaxID=272123 RepID=K9ZAQ7_ANACC|nr:MULTISPECIES: hypothetical protein [Anabaena]AFZ56273.1 hypothetical protein Anacy_0686 [Anabaena cylindrica PCC 7122]MBD2417504.1 hypothetical protein [Anabaena cylindrica FACHB-243]MBY5285169.1 hypothetical protein [Anabaena sp. CCAP 1446/1C]MBY5307401.1 hypothetical protein [Anabaena sp. CCAP 1446/1C]MCM2407673.1 hypothetical protein [Anabaena sp. CCAP 1446/1C]
MNIATFEASVSYNDMVGSVSVDNADQSSIYHWLDKRNLRNSRDELVFGITLSFGENRGEEIVNPVNVVFLLITGENIATLTKKINGGQVPLQVRRIETVMTFGEFFSLFKQFSLTLSPNQNKHTTKGIEFKGILEGVKYQYED